MTKLTVKTIEHKVKAAHKKRNATRSEENQIKTPNNALSLRWYPKLKLFKGANVSFDPIRMTADSYDWWRFICLIRGKLIFNAHAYSPTTHKQQLTVRCLLSELGLKIHAEVDMRQSLSPESFRDDSLHPIYSQMIQLEIEIGRKGSNKKSNQYRVQVIKRLKKQIKALRALGAKFSKANEKSLRLELMRYEADRLESMRAERESRKALRHEVRDAERMLMSANQYAVI